jgi:hypothetical protein
MELILSKFFSQLASPFHDVRNLRVDQRAQLALRLIGLLASEHREQLDVVGRNLIQNF